MKEKILQALKNKYKNLGLGDKALESIATMLATTTTEEAQIETAVAGVEDLAKGFQSEADRIRTEATRKAQEAAQQKKDDKGDQGGQGGVKGGGEDIPAWAKTLVDSIPALTQKIETLEKGSVSKTRQQVLEEKLKDAPESFRKSALASFNRMNFESDDDFNSYVQETHENAQEIAKHIKVEQLPGGAPQGRTAVEEEKTNKEIDAWVSSKTPPKTT